MLRENTNDLLAFLAVAEEGSFTKAAAKLDVSQSALSQNIRNLEQRIGLRLLTRTTRKVAPTEAGKRLKEAIAPRFEEIETELTALRELRDKPAGNIRITATEYAAETIIFPKLATFLPNYPDIQVEVSVDYSLTDIVGQNFDAGVRFGESVEKDMIAVRIGPDIRLAVVASPSYFENRTLPKTPQELTEHNCINLRLPTRGNLYAWEFKKNDRELNVHVNGQLVLNNATQILHAALLGLGLACVPEDTAQTYLDQGKLIRVLEDWCPTFAGHHLYYPNRRQASRAFSLVVEALRHQE